MTSRINRWAVGRRILGNILRRLVPGDSTKANITSHSGLSADIKNHSEMSGDIDQGPRVRGRRYLLGLVLVFAIGLTLFAMLPDRLLAAIELAYYRAAATTNAVFLEWATVREVNVN